MITACESTTGWPDVAMGLGILFFICGLLGFLIWMASHD